jgi:hypothetical protein
MRMNPRRHIDGSPLAALLLVMAAIPARAIDVAEVELTGSSISRIGAPANFGFPLDAPGLVTNDDRETLIGPHDDHDDASFVRDRLYRNDERINADHGFGEGGTARGSIEAGHSISVSTGYADAGSNVLGGFAEAYAGFVGPSSASAVSSMKIEKKITIAPGDSGLAAGDLVTGLRWVFDGDGTLEVGGKSYPNSSTSSAAVGIDLDILRGPTGRCGDFDCPHGAIAVLASLSTGLALQDADPVLPAGVTARVTRHDSWSASDNTGNLKAGAVFTSGSETVDVGLPITEEDAAITRVESVHTGAAPLNLDGIEFEANVGETLTVRMDLDVYGVVEGWGYGESDFFGSFDGHVADPLARGLDFVSSVPVPEPGARAAGSLAVALLALGWMQAARRDCKCQCAEASGSSSSDEMRFAIGSSGRSRPSL